jgi:hypothetical protein
MQGQVNVRKHIMTTALHLRQLFRNAWACSWEYTTHFVRKGGLLEIFLRLIKGAILYLNFFKRCNCAILEIESQLPT